MSSPTFAYDYKEFTTLAAFEAYVNSIPDAQIAWVHGVTWHHSYIPTLPQWHASTPRAELDGMAHYYQYEVQNKDGSVGWPAGPHVFISDVGIYCMTPLTHIGVHAGECNTSYWGMEIIGDYDNQLWSAATEYLVHGATKILLKKAKVKLVDITTLRGHRECNSPKTCPGKSISMDLGRKDMQAILFPTAPVVTPTAGTVDDPQVIGVPQSVTYDQWVKYLVKYGVHMLEPELAFIYSMCERLQVDAAFLAAVWKQESFEDDPDTPEVRQVIGGGPLQHMTHNPVNIKTQADDTHHKVLYKGTWWEAWESNQLGLIRAILYFKQEHGAVGRLTVHEIIPIHCPDIPENKNLPSAVYESNVRARMAEAKRM
jgi:hypothetical protein